MPQIQLRLSLPPQLGELLRFKAERLGLPLTQFVKYLILKDIEKEEYPIFPVSSRTEKKALKALKELDKSKIIEDLPKYLAKL